jgi:hypothetical protein
MTPDEFDDIGPPRRRRHATRAMLFAGVASACGLGVGLGLWARPAANERQMAAAAQARAALPAAPERKLQIVLDDHPAPVGAPIEVLPAVAPARAVAASAPPPEPQAPKRPPEGLMRVQAVASPPPMAAVPPRVVAKARPQPSSVQLAAAAAASATAVRKAELAREKAELARAQAAQAEVRRVEVARAEAARAQAHRVELARAEAARITAHQAKLARAEAAKAAAAHRIEFARQAKAAKAEQLRLAQAEARGRAEARAEAKAQAVVQARADARRRIQLASLMRAVSRAVPHQAKPHHAPPADLARLDRKAKGHRELKVERASLSRKPPRPAEPVYRVRPAPLPHPGLMKVSTPRCASRDPAAALVCSDASLGAADRQLARAYQGARAAGVPDAQLQRQQQRWLAARSAAAREAPWAVHDVYLARIAELNGQAHDAHGDGY